MKLYYYPISTTSRPIMLFAAESRIPLEMQVVDLFTGGAGRGDRQRLVAYSNVKRWLGRMKTLKSWPQVYQVIDGYAASLKDKPMVAL